MLVLTRKENESIIINGEIEIKLVDIAEGKVRIGIVAPKHIKVYRKEVYDQIVEENRGAQKSPQSQDVASLKAFMQQKKED